MKFVSLPRFLFGGLLLAALSSVSNPSLAAGLATGPAQLLVADRATNQILKYDVNTGASLGVLVDSSGGTLSSPDGLVVTPNNHLLVSNAGSGKVSEYDVTTGQFLGYFAEGLDQPTDIAYFNNKVYVGSLGPTGFDGEQIYVFGADGTQEASLGAGTGGFGKTGLAIGADGNLYAGSFFDSRIVRFDLSTGLPSGTNPGDTTGTFADLSGAGGGTGYLAYNNDQNILAVGLFAFNVASVNGSTGAVIGELIPATNGLYFPSDVLSLPDGSILVTSLGNDNPSNGLPLGSGFIGEFAANGTPINPFFIFDFTGAFQPSALAIYNPLAGDLNLDGFVGQDDLNIILAHWGQHVPQGILGDVNGDTFIGQDDLNVVLGEWGQGSLPVLTAARAIPEASSVIMMSLAIAGFACIIWRRRQSEQVKATC